MVSYKFNDTITSFGFKENTVDWCTYQKVKGASLYFLFYMLIIFYFLLMILTYCIKPRIFSKNFEMKDMGEASYVIVIEIFHDRSHGFLERFRIEKCSVNIVPI